MRKILGHDGPPTNLWTENLLTGQPLAECPVRTILRAHEDHPELAREVNARLRDYPRYERGVMYVAGGSADQPARYLAFMDLIDAQKNATEAKHFELMRKGDGDADG